MISCGAVPGGSTTCSGNGVCDNSSICICNSDLFTGRSDWVNAEGRDCQIVLPVIWGIWALNLLEILVVTIVAAPLLNRLWQHHLHVRKQRKKKGRKYSLRENLGLVSILPFWMVSIPTHTALAVYKVAERNASLGISLGPTILWMLSRISVDLSMTTARVALSISTMQSEGASPTAIKRREVLLFFFFLVSTASTFMVWPVYATGGQNITLAETLFSAHFIISAFLMAFNAVISAQLGRSVQTSLTESFTKLKDDRILNVRDRLVRAQWTECAALSLVALCYLVLGAIPPLWITHDYFWCSLWLLWPWLGLNSVLTLNSAQLSARGEKIAYKTSSVQETLERQSKSSRRASVTAPARPSDLKSDFMQLWNQALGISMKNIRMSSDRHEVEDL